ncbi:hypothetical protein BGX24_012168 [Mortierella sp. AD032]|nr:hypothetical protein BGX24_012168 [Mortierella sp. AD032]
MRSIPESVEELRLYQWDGTYFGDESVESSWLEYVDTEDVTAVQDDHGSILEPRVITSYTVNIKANPDTELCEPQRHSSKDQKVNLGVLNRRRHSTRNKAMGPLNGLGYAVVLCASLRGWKTIILSSDRPVNHGVLWQTSVLHHVDTLETLYLEGFEMDNWGALVGKVLDTAPRLKKLYIMPTQPHDMVWQPSELSETTNWACQDLEVLRIRYSFVGRTFDEQEEHDRFQQQLYRQLARLTKLKELILGDMESDELIMDEDDCGDHDFQDTPPSSSPLSVGNDEEQTRDRLRTINDIITPPKFLMKKCIISRRND